MATTKEILPGACDIDAAGEGWREALGLTVHPDPGHVHGVTALTQQEWRQLAHEHEARRYVVLYESPHMARRLASAPKALAAAWADLRTGLWTSAAAYCKPGYRISVMDVADFEQVKGGPR